MAFDDIYREYYRELRRFGRHLNISAEECEDLTQETFMRFYIETDRGVILKNPRAWLYKVFLNQYRTLCNSRRHESENPVSMSMSGGISTDIAEQIIEKEKQHIVFKMLDNLSEKDKAILILYNHGLSYSEMAEVLEINPNSVGTTLVRSIEKLKETLKHHYHEMFEQN